MATAAPSTLNVRDYLPKGADFCRAAIAIARAGEDGLDQAVKIAKHLYGEDSRAVACVKATVSATENADVNGTINPAAVEFFGAVFERSIPGQLQALRRRPAATRYLVNEGAMTGHWTGEGKPIPVLPLSFSQAHLGLLKVANIVVLTNETLEFADPAVERGIRQDMIGGLAKAIDAAFIDPLNGGSAGVTPASVTHGLTPTTFGTGDEDDVGEALTRMVEDFEGDLSAAVFVGSPQLFARFNKYRFGANVGIRGGELMGAPAIATKGLPAAGGFYQLALIDPTGIAYVDEPGATSIVASQNAAIEMLDNPTNDVSTPTATNLVSLWQCQCTGIRALAYANWAVEREGAVSLMLAFPEAAVS